MKVLMTAEARGGLWDYSLELVRATRPLGVEFVLATAGQRAGEEQRADAAACGNVILAGCDVRPAEDGIERGDVGRAGKWLLGIERQHAPDIVHVNHLQYSALPWRAPVLVMAHACETSRWRALSGAPAPSSLDHYRDRIRTGLENAAAVVAATRAMLEAVQCEHLTDVRGHVIPNASSAPIARRRKEPFIFAAGPLADHGKNLRAVADVAADLDWPVLAAGWDDSPDSPESSVPNVRAMGDLSPTALRVWLARSSIFVHPALYEPFGATALEAARAGCALVLGDIATLREVWGDAAVYVPPRDRGALTAALRRLTEDPGYCRALGRAARQRARRYRSARFGAAYHALYKEISGGQDSSSQDIAIAATSSGSVCPPANSSKRIA